MEILHSAVQWYIVKFATLSVKKKDLKKLLKKIKLRVKKEGRKISPKIRGKFWEKYKDMD